MEENREKAEAILVGDMARILRRSISRALTSALNDLATNPSNAIACYECRALAVSNVIWKIGRAHV